MKVSQRLAGSIPLLTAALLSRSALAQPAVAESTPPGSSEAAADDVPRLAFPTLGSGSGLLRMSTTDVGPTSEIRLGLHGEYFSASNFLAKYDTDSRLQGALTLSLSPLRELEIFAALLGSSNRNERCGTAHPCAAPREDPEVIKAMGDLAVGAKYARALGRGLSVAGEAGLRFLASANGLSMDFGATSLWFGGLAGYDLRDQANIPLRVHANLGMYVDNSGDLQNFSNLQQTTQVVSAFAYGQGRTRVRSAIGLDMPPQRLTPDFLLHPFVEYRIDYVTASANPNFVRYLPGLCDLPGSTVPCRDNRSQHALALGAAAQIMGGPILSAGLDIGVRSLGWGYGSPLPPVNFLFGLTYPLDVRRPKTVTVTKIVKEEPTTGLVAGMVASAKGNAPVADAVVTVVGQNHARTLTDPDGTFQTPEVKPGTVNLSVSAPNYNSTEQQAVVTAGQTTQVTLSLVPNPPAPHLRGRVSLVAGAGVEATVHLSGAKDLDGRTGPDGSFDVAAVPGDYLARVEAPTALAREMHVSLGESENKTVDFQLYPRPVRARVAVSGNVLALKQSVKFTSEKGQPTAVLDADSSLLLAEVIDLLVAHPEIRKLRVEAHVDTSINKKKAEPLTADQARAVVAHLVAQGIAPERLEAVGMGSGKPKVPNLGAAARLMNRRIEFHIAN